MTVNLVSAGTGFINKMKTPAFGNQFSNDFIQCRQAGVNFAITSDFALALLFGFSVYRLRLPIWGASLIFVPLVLLYQGWSYWVFRKRVTEKPEQLEY